ncbi:MAG: hypothetical protein JXA57_09950 [Armatimonadetes bacterium]|nr:hypothetical protein [Armatimonadota bacterium]
MTTELVPAPLQPRRLPPIQLGKASPAVRAEVHGFYGAIARVFEAWVKRRRNVKTRATYRNHVRQFTTWLGFRWPEDEDYAGWQGPRWPDNAELILRVGVPDVQRHRDELLDAGAAANTVNGRLSALSSF